MNKVFPKIKVHELPFIDSLADLSREEKQQLGILCATGRPNAYRTAFVLGRGGGRKEETWDRKKHCHTCCGSKAPWCHKTKCPRLSF
jgi:hypothetical protein